MVLMQKKFDCCVIDFETATHYNNSACSIGIVLIKDLEIVDQYYSLIQPPGNRFAKANIQIHGISSIETRNAPTFDLIWPEVEQRISQSQYTTAYNSQFDMGVLIETAKHYKISVPEFVTFDAMNFHPHYRQQHMKLSALARQFGLTFDAHNAIEDATVTGKILIETMKEFRENNWGNFLNAYQINTKPIDSYTTAVANHFKPKFEKFKKSLSISDINKVPIMDEFKDHWLQGKNVVLTGEFELGKDELMMKIRYRGAVLKSSVSKTTNVIVEGWQDPKYQDENGLVEKQRKARQLCSEGYEIKILSEDEMLDLL